jgi:ketosteroid isomerase-like protein
MNQVSDIVRKFFENYERNSNAPDLELVASQYSDSFMFTSPKGVQAIKKEDFLKVLPKRKVFFKTVGLTVSKIQSLEETRLDDSYVLVKVSWNMQFEKDGAQPIVDKISATYILSQQEDLMRIVFQLDHQDLMKRVQDLGLLPATD